MSVCLLQVVKSTSLTIKIVSTSAKYIPKPNMHMIHQKKINTILIHLGVKKSEKEVLKFAFPFMEKDT